MSLVIEAEAPPLRLDEGGTIRVVRRELPWTRS